MKIVKMTYYRTLSIVLSFALSLGSLTAQGLKSGAIAKGVDKATSELQDVGKKCRGTYVSPCA